MALRSLKKMFISQRNKVLVTDLMYFYKNTIIIKMTIVVVIPWLDICNVKDERGVGSYACF